MPHTGKSTILRNIVSNYKKDSFGLVTTEILEDGKRTGFAMGIVGYKNDKNKKSVIAHKKYHDSALVKVSSYGVRVKNLEKMVKNALGVERFFNKVNLFYLDEVGEIQLSCCEFKTLANEYLDSPQTCIMTVSSVYEHPFIEEIKKRKDVILIELTTENRNTKKEFIEALIEKIEKAHRYIKHPEKFSRNGNKFHLVSESELHRLINLDKKTCSCEFFKKYSICSHLLAAEELFGQK